jgi:hypothetical protein
MEEVVVERERLNSCFIKMQAAAALRFGLCCAIIFDELSTP